MLKPKPLWRTNFQWLRSLIGTKTPGRDLSSTPIAIHLESWWPRMDQLYEWRKQFLGDRVSDDFLSGAAAGCLATILLVLIARLVSILRNDVYDLSHWKLNIRVPIQPMWMNMGYWWVKD